MCVSCWGEGSSIEQFKETNVFPYEAHPINNGMGFRKGNRGTTHPWLNFLVAKSSFIDPVVFKALFKGAAADPANHESQRGSLRVWLASQLVTEGKNSAKRCKESRYFSSWLVFLRLYDITCNSLGILEMGVKEMALLTRQCPSRA